MRPHLRFGVPMGDSPWSLRVPKPRILLSRKESVGTSTVAWGYKQYNSRRLTPVTSLEATVLPGPGRPLHPTVLTPMRRTRSYLSSSADEKLMVLIRRPFDVFLDNAGQATNADLGVQGQILPSPTGSFHPPTQAIRIHSKPQL